MISNFHTHTLFCDGKNSPEEMVREALSLGCPAIGFSGHSFTPFDPGYCMDADREQAYQQEVQRLKKAYAGQISVWLGLELDYYSEAPSFPYEYRIGSAHYISKDGEYLSIDDTPELLRDGVQRLYGGDFYAMAEDYFSLVSQVPEKTSCQIVGHFDLITKFNEKYPFFDSSEPRYRSAALQALHALKDQNTLLEINTGAMSRGWRTVPYPESFLLEEMGKLRMKAILSSDAHRKEDLLFGLSEARQLCEAFHIQVVDSPF